MNKSHIPLVLIRGGGNLASGVALRLFHSRFGIVITELAQPLTVRRFAFPEHFTLRSGPGVEAGQNCNAMSKTNRGPALDRVYWQDAAQADTAEPEAVRRHIHDRVLRAPQPGLFTTEHEIGEIVEPGTLLGSISGTPQVSPFKAVIRGLLRSRTFAQRGLKIGDLNPRCDRSLCFMASDKALAMGAAVLEALLLQPEIRRALKGEA